MHPRCHSLILCLWCLIWPWTRAQKDVATMAMGTSVTKSAKQRQNDDGSSPQQPRHRRHCQNQNHPPPDGIVGTTTQHLPALTQKVEQAWHEFWRRHVSPIVQLSRRYAPLPLLASETPRYDHPPSALEPAVFQTHRRGRAVYPDEFDDNDANDDHCDNDANDDHCDDDFEDQDARTRLPHETVARIPPLVCRDDKFSPDRRLPNNEPHIGMVLEVYSDLHGRLCAPSGASTGGVHDETNPLEDTSLALRWYQLEEPLHLELGSTVKHAADFAYDPVITAGTESIRITEDTYGGDSRTDHDALEGRPHSEWWWQWWIPWWKWDGSQDHSQQYRMHSAFAGGSHGEVWRGRRKCRHRDACQSDALIFKRLRIENGYRVLEAGLREIYFGNLLTAEKPEMFTYYEDHFFREREDREPELWIVFRDAGPSLRSFIYSGNAVGDFIIYQHSPLWTQLRTSVSKSQQDGPVVSDDAEEPVGRDLFRRVLRQVLEAAAFLHQKGIVHRDIKPSNVMCQTDLDPNGLSGSLPLLNSSLHCVLGDFSSAWDKVADGLYTGGPSRAEQTDEYAPPESFFDQDSPWLLSPAFDSWSIGIVALELLLGTPNVFTVDQRTKAVLTHQLRGQGASAKEIQRAMYLAALSQFCIYNPRHTDRFDWPLGVGDPLHNSAMVKGTCTLNDFHRALRARDPLGIGFDSSADQLLLLIWRLLDWDPSARITPYEALQHPYFLQDLSKAKDGGTKALESQMLDPRRDFNATNAVTEFICPGCGRIFTDWQSCHSHANARRHAKFCHYDHSGLPSCLNAHSMLPAHIASGHCDIQGRRSVIEDMHAVQLTATEHFYGIFDGHSGNRASKYVASFLFTALKDRLEPYLAQDPDTASETWTEEVSDRVQRSFLDVHNKFLDAIALIPQSRNDQSGTTATVAYVTNKYLIIASLGDSRAVLSTKKSGKYAALQLTRDHVASDPMERAAVEHRGGTVKTINGIDRVNGTLVVSRSLGDALLSSVLSQTPEVIPYTRAAILELCGDLKEDENIPCFLILASDGLWDTVSNQEAVDLVIETIRGENNTQGDLYQTALQRSAEALVHEAFVRGSSDNIGVCVISLGEGFLLTR